MQWVDQGEEPPVAEIPGPKGQHHPLGRAFDSISSYTSCATRKHSTTNLSIGFGSECVEERKAQNFTARFFSSFPSLVPSFLFGSFGG
jgi:hypothetical protein